MMLQGATRRCLAQAQATINSSVKSPCGCTRMRYTYTRGSTAEPPAQNTVNSRLSSSVHGWDQSALARNLTCVNHSRKRCSESRTVNLSSDIQCHTRHALSNRTCSSICLGSFNRNSSALFGSTAVRYSSTSTLSSETEILHDGGAFLPPPGEQVIDVPSIFGEISQSSSEPVLNSLGEPTLSSLGLAGSLPPGWIQSGLEMLHVSLDLPWFAAIALGTVLIRLCMFPLVIKAQRNAAKMHNHMPTVQALQSRFTEAKKYGNMAEAQRYGTEMIDYMKRNDIKIIRSFLVPLAQVPVFISVFSGLRGMANLPVESMMTGGILWFTDLTVQDPTWMLPVITMATFLATIELGVDTGMKLGAMGNINMKWVFRCLPIVTIPVMIKFPAALLVYWFTSNAFSLVQVGVLKIPAVRDALGIERMIKHETATIAPKPGFTQGFKQSWESQKAVQQLMERAAALEKAGIRPSSTIQPATGKQVHKYEPSKHRTRTKTKNKDDIWQ